MNCVGEHRFFSGPLARIAQYLAFCVKKSRSIAAVAVMFPQLKPAVSIVRRRLDDAARALRARTTSRRSRLVSGARRLAVTARDGLGHVAPIVEEGPASSLPKSDDCRAALRSSSFHRAHQP
jgi:hypothetical protein